MTPFRHVPNRLRALTRLAALAGLLGLAGAAGAAPVPVPAHELTAVDAEAWLDGLVPAALHTAHTPGAVVVIVRGGQVLLEKGYGYADLAKQVPVDPHQTLFRPGSTSKLFTWTAVMQLVEQGKLDLDVDVNRYLDFTIPPYDGKPLTLRQIMTHTTGFEETIKDLIAFDEAEPPLGDVLKRYVPPRRAEPGSVSGYSNYAAALAGYIVQRVSGEPFETYVEKHIFTPLGMASSSFRQPLPPALLARMATGYETSEKPGLGYELVNLPPAGSLASSGDDMAHFMIAHLHEGDYDGARILQPATAKRMHESITRLFPDLNGIALGFYEQNINGHRVIAHGGDLNYFHSDLALFLDDDVGIFISVNAVGKDGMGEMIRESVFRQFADRYYPQPGTIVPLDAATAHAHAALIAGSYLTSRRADSTFLSVIGLLAPTDVTANPDGSITAKTLLDPETYVEIKPFLWQQRGGPDKLQAQVVDGRVVRWSTNDLAFGFDFERPTGVAALGIERPLGVLALVVFVLAALQWPGAALVRRSYRQPLGLVGARRLAYHLVGAAAVLALVALGTWVAFVAEVAATQRSHLDPLLHTAQALAFIAFCGGALASLWHLGDQLRDHRRWPALAWTGVRLLAFGVAVWLGFSYHLIGLSGNY